MFILVTQVDYKLFECNECITIFVSFMCFNKINVHGYLLNDLIKSYNVLCNTHMCLLQYTKHPDKYLPTLL